VLNGGDGDDILTGGLGSDQLTGGAGSDTFKFNSLGEIGEDYPYEQITDFTAGDKIDLNGVDANASMTGDQDFAFLGENSFTGGVAGQLRYQYGIVSGDVNGDANADFYLQVGSGLPYPVLTSTDFFL